MTTRLPGEVNEHIVGIVMKEAVRRAITAIREQRFVFEAQRKVGYSGELDDMLTTADNAAQNIYIRILKECFPGYGILAEEDGLRVECEIPGVDIFFTVDPLDGTKAFVRKQSHGVGTMVALVREKRVIAAYVGDVMTQEIFGFRPDSSTVWRISEFDHSEPLKIREDDKLSGQWVLLRRDPEEYSLFMQSLARSVVRGGIFQGIEITGGSIGTCMARLWKGEVGAVLLSKSHETPWDLAPILGISQAMGFVFLKPLNVRKLVVFEPEAPTQITKRDHDWLVIHESRLGELGQLV